MPVAFDAASSAVATASSLSWSHTCSGSDRLLEVAVEIRVSPLPTVNSVTYAGVALSLVGGQTDPSGFSRSELWRLVAPATGANTVAITLSAAADIIGGAVSMTGVDQTTPLGTFASASGQTDTATVGVASAGGELVMDAPNNDTAVFTIGAGQTERWNTAQGGLAGAGSTEPGAGTVTMSWTFSPAGNWATVGVSAKAAAAPGGPSAGLRTLSMTGAGI